MLYLYKGSVPDFIHNAQLQIFASQLEAEFVRRFGYETTKKEVASWRNSLRALSFVLQDTRFQHCHILLEFKMPTCSSRCDAIVTGEDSSGNAQAVVVELKQWQFVRPSAVRDHVTTSGYNSLHASAQARQYCEYLHYYHKACTSQRVRISGCAYLHNLSDKKSIAVLNDPSIFGVLHKEYPVFTAENVPAFQTYLASKVGNGGGAEIADELINGGIEPSTKLLDVVSEVIKQDFEWRLIDEQLTAFATVISEVESLKDKSGKAILLVRGGPGTGKSVLAIQLLAYAAGKHWRVAHASGSKAFQTVLDARTQLLADEFLKNVFGVKFKRQLPVSQLFSTFANIAQVGAAKENEFDLVIGDEAHRLWDYRRRKFRGMNKQLSITPMIQEVVRASKVTVLFLDENQSVRVNEIGNVEYIRGQIEQLGYGVELIDLTAQFRCLGSRSYLDWVDHVLGYGAPHSLSWIDFDAYDFRVMNSMQDMQKSLDEAQGDGYSSRIVAGFCWNWSKVQGHGGLVHDVSDPRFEGWSAPWIEKTAPNVKSSEHRYFKWATDNSYSNQVGSIYSVQGFEFDYVGLIFGEDLVIRAGNWVGDLGKNKDPVFKSELRDNIEQAMDKLRNIYRVLLTRGMRGTFVYFLDEETRDYFRRMLG